MLDNLNAGKGTAGKLLTDDQIYTQLDLITQKVNTAHGQDQLGSGHHRPADGESAALRFAERRHAAKCDDLVKDFEANPKKFLRIKLALF